jgi:hypothetical protein
MIHCPLFIYLPVFRHRWREAQGEAFHIANSGYCAASHNICRKENALSYSQIERFADLHYDIDMTSAFDSEIGNERRRYSRHRTKKIL